MKYKSEMTKENDVFIYEYTYSKDGEIKRFILSEKEFDKIEKIEDEKFKPRAKVFKRIVENIKKLETEKEIDYSFERHDIFDNFYIDFEPSDFAILFIFAEGKEPYLYCLDLQEAYYITINPNDVSFIKNLFISTFEGKDRLKWFGTSVWEVYNNEIKS